MFNFKVQNAESILKRSKSIKSAFLKMREDLFGVNEDLMVESARISAEISELQNIQTELSDESIVNGKVIKNIDKILGV